MKIAIQGGQASFHHMAARQYFNDSDIGIIECPTFRKLCNTLRDGSADLAVMAIENTLVGSILPNYHLLQTFPVHIIGEIYLHIEQNLMALPGQSLEGIRCVRSHPMALLQCSDFLEQHPGMLGEETADTAESAREIRERGLNGVAAIAGRLAAELYDLEILAERIENLKHNYTRFLILSPTPNHDQISANKASVNFHLRHQVGALADALNIFRDHEINLTLIQSIALPTRPHEYAFHADLEWEQPARFEQAMQQIRTISADLQILGIYQKGERPYDRYSQSA
ncbi:MAG: prephenate dehydratase [Calditrichae bacterium]|nr:prephenate dehydratase [Calditrichota bacterium]MCB0315362.1 prephenate dehydratase [Calditrichota bacterium]MCB9087324.1 prephenate dehydratase [Calditrichia bacterium]